MSLLTLARSPTFDDGNLSGKEEGLKNDEEPDVATNVGAEEDVFDETIPLTPRKIPKLARLRSPSFEGYFASRSGAFALNTGNFQMKPTAEKIGEIQLHLERMVSLLRDVDVLRMAVRVESRNSEIKRYLTVVSSEVDHSAVIGIDWTNAEGPTIGLVLPLWSSTTVNLDGDGGFHISRTLTRNHIFKPVSVQTLWSAKQVIDKAVDYSRKHKYFEGISTNGFLEYYENFISSDPKSIAEWNEMDDLSSHIYEYLHTVTEDEKTEAVKNVIRAKLRDVMRVVDLENVTCREIRLVCEKELDMDLKKFKTFIDEEMLVVMGQMDSASQILDYLYLGSEWNASNLVELKELGIGYILNMTREVDNFFPQTFAYYNVRVYDVEETELLKHWDHTYRFIEKAHETNSKVLVHCRHGISRSASTVIAYVMKKKGWGMGETLDYVKRKRSIVQPNPGFQKQLIIYEGILNSSRNRFSSLFHHKTKQQQHEREAATTSSEKRKQFSKTRASSDKYDGIEANEKDAKKTKHEDSVSKTTDEEDGVIVNAREEIRPMLHAEMSIAEEVEIDMVRQYWNSPGPQRGRLRAKTMTSGAVFIDEDEFSDVSKSSTVNSEETELHSDLTDADEDAVMLQVMQATHMKNELMKSVLNLNNEPSGEKPMLSEHNVKPSMLRKLSHGSAVMHLQNLADMKKRKSLSDTAKETILELEEESNSARGMIQKNTVSKLREVFKERSIKHVRDYARRRTLDDDQIHSFVKDDDTIEVPVKPPKFEIASKTEKILPKTKPQYPRYRYYGNMNRSVSLRERRQIERQGSIQDGDTLSNSSMEALNLETGENHFATNNLEGSGNEQYSDEYSVADLVHLHDQFIREKVLKFSLPFLSPAEDDKGIDTRRQEHEDTKLYEVLVRGKLTGVNNSSSLGVKRTMSYPRTKRSQMIDNADIHTCRLQQLTDSKSLPSSPFLDRRGSRDLLCTQPEPGGRLLKDVRAIVDTFEVRRHSLEETSSGKNKSSDYIDDLRSKDDTVTVHPRLE